MFVFAVAAFTGAVVEVVFVCGAVVVDDFARCGEVDGEFAPEAVHAARNRPPATTIGSNRTTRFIGVLSLVPGEEISVGAIYS